MKDILDWFRTKYPFLKRPSWWWKPWSWRCILFYYL
jgi:hypothetical protein